MHGKKSVGRSTNNVAELGCRDTVSSFGAPQLGYMKSLLLGHSDVSTTMTYTHVLEVAPGGTSIPLDSLSSLHVRMGAISAEQPVANTIVKR